MSMIKKAGIVTFTYGENYGQRLQNYAVQEILKQYAEEIFTLRAAPPKISAENKFRNFLRLIRKHNYFTNKRRIKSFKDFDEKFISYNRCCVENGFLENEAEFDYFVAGSDQIWSPYSPDVNESMFLTFATPEKRIALSPSIAANEIPAEKENLYQKYFDGFAYLSVREEKGAELIEKISGRKAEVLADPTLVVNKNEWKKLADYSKVRFSTPYVFVYCLGNEKNSIIKRYADEHQCRIIDIMSNEYYSSDPCDFLHLIRNAKVVFTDSFHASIFSCIFHVPFVILVRKGTKLNMNSRFDTLFSKLGIVDRSEDNVDLSRIDVMDFDDIERNIKLEQIKVYQYLDKVFYKNS